MNENPFFMSTLYNPPKENVAKQINLFTMKKSLDDLILSVNNMTEDLSEIMKRQKLLENTLKKHKTAFDQHESDLHNHKEALEYHTNRISTVELKLNDIMNGGKKAFTYLNDQYT